jgi:hypothetical protein
MCAFMMSSGIDEMNNALFLNAWQVDIDDILRMAETRNTEEMKNSATDELLSQFKV